MVAEGTSQKLAKTFGDLAVAMQAQRGNADTLKAIVESAVQIVPGARWAGLSLIRDKHVVPEVPTSQEVVELDRLQTDLGDGPCITALRDHHTVLVDDMRTDSRWPAFGREAVSLGVLSLLSFQLFVRSQSLGALNMYGDEVAAFTEESILVGGILAQHAAIAMIGSSAEGQFGTALASRDVIGQAKGMLMLRNNVSGLAAFQMLITASQDTNMKLVDVARWLIEEHESKLPKA